jgi:hypothetical protein
MIFDLVKQRLGLVTRGSLPVKAREISSQSELKTYHAIS